MVSGTEQSDRQLQGMTAMISRIERAFGRKQRLSHPDATPIIQKEPSSVLEKFWQVVRLKIPVGYQDDTGFHYGEHPERKEISHPAFW